MGLCKCPKKKVTNLFCFEHRVNVCEHCLVANHPRCVVQSYLQWLQDSDYNPVCRLCNQGFPDEGVDECVRLICYDVFHWNCLNQYAHQLPPNTAPAGYTCPTCSSGIFPPNNLASPVADVLRDMLSTVNWARAGLGLPLIEETSVPTTRSPADLDDTFPTTNKHLAASTPGVFSPNPNSVTFPSTQASHTRPSAQVSPYTSTPTSGQSVPHSSVINVESGGGASARSIDGRRPFDSMSEPLLGQDHDDDKYKRRPALRWLAQWFSSRQKTVRRDPRSTMKRLLIITVLGILAFITVIIILSQLGRKATENDPFLDPMANPNIRVQQVADSGVLHD